MQVYETGFSGLFVLEPKVFQDERGFFLESYNKDSFRLLDIECDFVQDNHAYSKDLGVLRGFHFQRPPMAQAKLVWVTRGAVLDVVIDLRLGSVTYGKYAPVVLSASNFKRMFIPKGFGHAYITIMPDTEFQYKVDAPYSPDHEGGIAWDDPTIGMDWTPALHGQKPILSEKDRRLSRFVDFHSPFIYEDY
ncbi:dTDP-4-dehydrorhamnose 3,5-epimerase [Pseudodesulfovibrio piezophilus]|uniref:dTDP-4-dehydrorhamnose 3,5-epimerase n=1 Tax=Pseudodesulfovibrio piezophilus (strain DSM 21447 / JCM 15486 / C1TLV30) TaxID=1322246 RepID=M1WNX6_PSEP2|nr:dTDP-4-dehydrorhamnose 3,5-epimerase [Pseudodesulfovibrio piezophilus]CCH47854.1 dTDP-4-dehydrorhamnose 3,5-epimerase [Pseudodesulfovibrio piezophilus C1TLV30]